MQAEFFHTSFTHADHKVGYKVLIKLILLMLLIILKDFPPFCSSQVKWLLGLSPKKNKDEQIYLCVCSSSPKQTGWNSVGDCLKNPALFH